MWRTVEDGVAVGEDGSAGNAEIHVVCGKLVECSMKVPSLERPHDVLDRVHRILFRYTAFRINFASGWEKLTKSP